jgi:hypothetical protein
MSIVGDSLDAIQKNLPLLIAKVFNNVSLTLFYQGSQCLPPFSSEWAAAAEELGGFKISWW